MNKIMTVLVGSKAHGLDNPYSDEDKRFVFVEPTSEVLKLRDVKEEIFDTMLTRNEHFLGFVTDMTVYSDVFVERGKQGVTEHNLRLGEIDNVGELDIYGNGFYTVRKS